MQANELVVRTSEPPRLRMLQRVREISARREVLLNLVRKELKVKYVSSVLGAAWSLLNPVVFLGVFTFVAHVMGAAVPHFAIYLLSALLGWNLFTTSVTGAARSVIDNANLVKKVAFPREILPLSTVGVALVDYVLQMVVLLVFMLVVGYRVPLSSFALLPLAFAALMAFTLATSFLIAALNVRYRDVQHLLNLGLLVWFWMTPIVYGEHLVQTQLQGTRVAGIGVFKLYLLNPMASISLGFHRALYGFVTPAGADAPVLATYGTPTVALILAVVLVVSLVALRLAWRLFFDLSGDFAEEL